VVLERELETLRELLELLETVMEGVNDTEDDSVEEVVVDCETVDVSDAEGDGVSVCE
jgi:hypothetical protein